MTRIDFHSQVQDKLAYTCRLVRKARTAQCQVVVLARDADELHTLDQALWTFSDQDFVPHVPAGDPLATATPVILADDDTAELPHHDVLINLSGRTPAYFARFQRLIEIVSTDENDRLAGRERYRFYQQRGYPLTHHTADKA